MYLLKIVFLKFLNVPKVMKLVNDTLDQRTQLWCTKQKARRNQSYWHLGQHSSILNNSFMCYLLNVELPWFGCRQWVICWINGRCYSNTLKNFFGKKCDQWSSVKTLDSQYRGPMFKTTGWLQGWLSLSSFRGR